MLLSMDLVYNGKQLIVVCDVLLVAPLSIHVY